MLRLDKRLGRIRRRGRARLRAMRLARPLLAVAVSVPVACVSIGQASEAPGEPTQPEPVLVAEADTARTDTDTSQLAPAAVASPPGEEASSPPAPPAASKPRRANVAVDPGSLSAQELVDRFEDILRGNTSYIVAEMTITTPRWQRSLRFRSWDDGVKDRNFIRILAPKKDRGTGFLRLERTLWTYLPRVERTTRIPPSMMMQSWMGSDFTNDDIARESSVADDYDAAKLPPREIAGVPALGVELFPKPEAPIVWAKLELWASEGTFAPLQQDYYDEPRPGEFERIRSLHFSEFRDVQGRPMPHRWRMEPLDKPGHQTEFRLEEIRFDLEFEEDIFTQAHLKRAEAVR